MPRVKEWKVGRLLVAFELPVALSIREDWLRKLFGVLQDEYPDLFGMPLIVPDQSAIFLRPASGDAPPQPICIVQGQAIQTIMDTPTPEEQKRLPSLAASVFSRSREMLNIPRVRRVGRVQQSGYILDGEEDVASRALRDRLTKLDASEAHDVQLQFSVREDIFNLNLTLSTGASSKAPGPSGLPSRDVIVAQSDVNNWDTSRDVDSETVKSVLSRGETHANAEVPDFLRARVDLELPEGST